MRIFITGVSCIGKTAIGSILASRLSYAFFDLDQEIERFFGISIEQLRSRFLTVNSFITAAAKALANILTNPNTRDCVIALPPSGLMGSYLRVVKKAGGLTVVLTDKPENILNRITFYDIDSRPVEKQLTEKEKHLYLWEIKKDITYFRKSYSRGDLQVDISSLSAGQAAEKVRQSLDIVLGKEVAPK